MPNVQSLIEHITQMLAHKMLQEKYSICVVSPQNYTHSRAFDEIAESLLHALTNLSYDVVRASNTCYTDRTTILLGGNLLNESDLKSLPRDTIIYNFEQLSDDSTWLSDAYKYGLENFQVWDYRKQNIRYLDSLKTLFKPMYVPIGYCQELEKIRPAAHQDIDVLFYGSLNQRRKSILRLVEDQNLRMKCLFNVYGEERDDYISRSKVVLNLHYYDAQILEIARISYLLNNKIAVVSEYSDSTEVYEHLRNDLCLVDKKNIPSTIVKLIKDSDARDRIKRNGHTAFSQVSQTELVKAALERNARNRSLLVHKFSA